jgi:hypothetical protein
VEAFSEVHIHIHTAECRVEPFVYCFFVLLQVWAVSSLETASWAVDTSLSSRIWWIGMAREREAEKRGLMNKTISQTSFLPSFKQQHDPITLLSEESPYTHTHTHKRVRVTYICIPHPPPQSFTPFQEHPTCYRF